MWGSINQILNAIFDALLWPVSGLGDFWQLLVLALPAALLGLLVFRYASDQPGIEAAKERIKAHLLELLLFRDDFGVTFRAQGQILRHNLIYMRKALLPMAIMIGPFVLMLIQVESRFAHRSLAPGESVILAVTVDGERPPSELETALELGSGLRQETPALRNDADGQILWRIRAEQPGEHRISVRIGDTRVERSVRVGTTRTALATDVLRANDLALLAHPAAVPLPADSPAANLWLGYPPSGAVFAGLSGASWIFMAAAVVLGFALRGPLGVSF